MSGHITVQMDPADVAAASAAAGIDPGMRPGDQVRAIIRQLAGTSKTPSATAAGGAAPKRAGRRFELDTVRYCNENGFPKWEPGVVRGRRDLLDIVNSMHDGLLIGCKAIEPGVPMSQKLWRAMDQCHRAMDHLPRNVNPETVTPFQVIQRRGAGSVGSSYAVTELDWMLRQAAELVKLRKG